MKERFQTFTVLITGIHRSIRRIKMSAMTVFDLKSCHVSCIYYLYKDSALTAAELCERCEEDKANISRALVYLEENGYLALRPSRRRYRIPLELTEKGIEVGKYISEKIAEVLQMSSAGVCETDLTVMYESLATIGQNLQSICDQNIFENDI